MGWGRGVRCAGDANSERLRSRARAVSATGRYTFGESGFRADGSFMGFYWTYKSLPEFRNVTPNLREAVWRRCIDRSKVKQWEWATYGVTVIVFAMLKTYVLRWLGLEGEMAISMVAAFISLSIPVVIVGQFIQRRAR